MDTLLEMEYVNWWIGCLLIVLQLTFADLLIFVFFDFIPEGTIDKFPLLVALHKRVAERPRIAEWLRIRPVTDR
jgi:glutathione S-transferase